MVLFILSIKADLENIERIEIPPCTQWCLDLAQPNSDEQRKGVFVSEEEEHEIEGSRGTANFLMKWPGAKKPSQLDVLREVKKVTRAITAADSGEFVPVVGFECRGLEPIAFYFGQGFRAISAGETSSFDEVDLSDDWVDYDEEGDQSVGIFNLEYKIEVHKNLFQHLTRYFPQAAFKSSF